MGIPVGELGERMSSEEFPYWAAYAKHYPFGASRDNVHSAIIASTIANANRGKSQRAFKVEDFMIKPPTSRKEKLDGFVEFLQMASKS